MTNFAELWCKTNFSFLEGASHAEELVTRAIELGYKALAITDRNSLAGIVRAYAAAKEKPIQLLVGAEIHPIDGPPIVLLARSHAGYRALSRLVTKGRRRAEKGECLLEMADIVDAPGEWLAVVPPPDEEAELAPWRRYAEAFAGAGYLAASLHLGPDDDAELSRLAEAGRQIGLPMIASNQTQYHHPARRRLHDVLTAVRHHTTVAGLGALRLVNGERHLHTPEQLAWRFRRYPEAIRRTIEAADQCEFRVSQLRYEYPPEICPPGQTPTEYLTQKTWEGAKLRYPAGIPEKIRTLLERELALIAELSYEAFFLTVRDLVVFARSRGILCQGRGSAANSAVCYCLGITAVDPDRSDLLFERFISRERNEPPDIDVDFEHERREEVLQYIYNKYGRERAGLVAEVISYRPRSAVRDVGKALGLSIDAVDRLAKAIDWSQKTSVMAERVAEAGLDANAQTTKLLLSLVSELVGFPRHLSQHVGGFVITREPLSELVPIENAAMVDRTVIQWDKDDIETLGILKVDCLSLGMLTAIRKTFEMIDETMGERWTLATVPAEDPATYDMIGKADTVGVFQIESRAQMSMLPRLKPRCFYDLVVEVAIVRPGPIQGGMVHPYLRRRAGVEPVTYPNPIAERVLAKTLGVPLFQEQVMRLAMEAAGFTPGEADQLRRAMGAWKKTGVLEPFREKFRTGLLARGFPEVFADQIFEQIKGFGEYGFPESHAASFALLAYVSAWLKRHYPAAFAASLINSQPMGFYDASQILLDARQHGVIVRPIDIHRSEWDCTLEKDPGEGDKPTVAIRLGFRLVRGLAEAPMRAMLHERQSGLFRSIADLTRRCGTPRGILVRLAAADVFASMGLHRRSALWKALDATPPLPLFADLDDDDPAPRLPAPSPEQDVVADYGTTGLSLKAHPIGLVRADLDRMGVTTSDRLPKLRDKEKVKVAGLVLVRQRPPTAKGTVFMTLEDEHGFINLVIWDRTWQKLRKMARHAVGLLVEGKIEKADGVIHVCATKMEDLSTVLRGLESMSRDFR